VTSSLPCDYDEDPERWRTNRLSVERYSVAGDVAQVVVVPLDVTKRGVLVWARR
jgi:hypothetical protein